MILLGYLVFIYIGWRIRKAKQLRDLNARKRKQLDFRQVPEWWIP